LTSLVLDIIVAFIFLFFVVRFGSKGFVRSFFHIVCGLLSLLFSFVLSEKLSPAISEKFVEPFIGDKTSVIADKFSELFSFNYDFLGGIFNPFTSLSKWAAEELSGNISVLVTRIFLFLILFVAFSLLLKTITIFIDSLFKLPVLSTLNKIGGALMGFFLRRSHRIRALRGLYRSACALRRNPIFDVYRRRREKHLPFPVFLG